MRMSAPKEIARGLLVTAASSLGGGFIGFGLLLTNPIAGIGVWPFTLFESTTILLPIYLWFRDNRNLQLAKCYAAVIAAGSISGPLFILVILGGPGEYSRWTSLAFLRLLGIGASCGFGSSIVWVAVHYITRSRSTAKLDCL